MSDVKIEKDWVTESGLRAIVAVFRESHRCGYVEIPKNHEHFGADYDGVDVVVHGGLTFAGTGNGTFPGADDSTWFLGYDCAHAGDGFLPGSPMAGYSFDSGEPRSLEYCVGECESLASQLQERRVEV